MTLFMIAMLLVNPWLHDYGVDTKNTWTDKYRKIYQTAVKKHGLAKYKVDWHLLRAIAVIESRQQTDLRGGGGNSFWGLFQISHELVKQFSNYSRRDLFNPTINTEIFCLWMKYYLRVLYSPHLKKRPANYRKITPREWYALIYAGHNIGPNLVKWSLNKKYPLRWLVKRVVRKRGKKDGLYRTSLFILTPKLRQVSMYSVFKTKLRVQWWSRKDKMLGVLGYGKGKLTWNKRTKFISKFQKNNGLPVTGIWDNLTENQIIHEVIQWRKIKKQKLPKLLRKYSVLAIN